jgi:membrane protein DedA with SNARE-associated domain
MLVPSLPELFVMGFFASRPTLSWGITLLAVVCTAEVASNAVLYWFVKRSGLPPYIEHRMRQWVDFLIVSDERVILMNRVAPVIPFMGAFIATMNWDVRKSFFYVFLGSLAKYAVLMALVSVLFVYFEKNTARNFTLIAIIALVAVSFVHGHYAKERRLGPSASRSKLAGDVSRLAAATPGEDDKRHGNPDEGHKQKGSEAKDGRS